MCRHLETWGGLERLNASSRGVTSRCEELSVKFAEAGLHAVMLQETRLQVKGIASTSKYDLYRSPANEQGLDGTHVWLDKDAGFSVQASVAQHRRIVERQRFVARVGSWYLDMLQWRTVHLRTHVNFFMNNSKKVLSPAVGKRFPIVLGIDANGVLGSIVSESVGAVNASTESLNGMMLRSMCQADKLKLVNTFVDGAPTWASSAGNGRRIDFIAVSRSHFEAVTGCWVDRSIDIAPGGRDDHWVLAVRLDFTVAKDLVGNPSSGDSGVNSVFSLVSLQRIDPISRRDPARLTFKQSLAV